MSPEVQKGVLSLAGSQISCAIMMAMLMANSHLILPTVSAQFGNGHIATVDLSSNVLEPIRGWFCID